MSTADAAEGIDAFLEKRRHGGVRKS